MPFLINYEVLESKVKQTRTILDSLPFLWHNLNLIVSLNNVNMPSHQSRRTLSISPAPFKSSFLSIPPSPFSPRAPLTPTSPPIKLQHYVHPASTCRQAISNTPSKPLSWMWFCHKCHNSYHLGATRRCLEDGHRFCSGNAMVKLWRKSKCTRRVRKHRACGSEFDYQGWKIWGRWRRGVSQLSSGYATKSNVASSIEKISVQISGKDCWNTCDYPSECRWGRNIGIYTPVEVSFQDVGTHSTHPLVEPGDVNIGAESCNSASQDPERSGLRDTLTANVERRKCGQASSPLAVVTGE